MYTPGGESDRRGTFLSPSTQSGTVMCSPLPSGLLRDCPLHETVPCTITVTTNSQLTGVLEELVSRDCPLPRSGDCPLPSSGDWPLYPVGDDL